MVLVAGGIFLALGRPVFFKQTRPGLYGRPFVIIKFRTMTNDTQEDGSLLPDRLRMTTFGRFLRNSSLDELPELYNVLKGEMSLVGPRPLLMEYLDRYTQEQARRHEVLPGITGWAQINGRNMTEWHQRFHMDVWYVDNRNTLIDMHNLVKTILKTIKREGINFTGHATMEKYAPRETVDRPSSTHA